MRRNALLSAFFAVLFAAGCTGPDQAGTKQTIGALGGAALGGLFGAQFGSGSGRLATTAAGTLLGALVGSEIGRSMDQVDRIRMDQANQRAQAAPLGTGITWNNPDSGNYGTVTPVRDGTSSTGQYCREFQQTVTVGGKTEQAYGIACRQPDGSWRVSG